MQKTMLDVLKRDLAANGVRPLWYTLSGAYEPLCDDRCPSHDGIAWFEVRGRRFGVMSFGELTEIGDSIEVECVEL